MASSDRKALTSNSGGPTSVHFRIEPLSDGVVAVIAGETGAALSNSILVDLGDRTLVFDTMMTPIAASDLKRVSQSLFGEQPFVVVNSHCHQDHLRGNMRFPGSPIWATGTTRKTVQKRGLPSIEERRREYEGELKELGSRVMPEEERRHDRAVVESSLACLEELRLVPPNSTFEKQVDLYGPDRSARLLSYGGGHSPSDAFLLLPRERILATGDLVTIGIHPCLPDGAPERWRRILARMGKLPFDRVVPGHGPIGAPEDLSRVSEYIERLLELARPPADPAARAEIPGPFRSWGMSSMFEENRRFLIERAQRAAAPSDGRPDR